MKYKNILLLIITILFAQTLFAQNNRTDGNLIGHVVCCGEHIPFVNVTIKGTTIGTTTDETGHYQFINLPEGKHTVIVQALGYKSQEKDITIKDGKTIELKFDIKEDALGLDEVVVTGDRNQTNRVESSTIINTITPKLFAVTQSVTLSESLNFSPGLRMENDCQNCGFTQVRMNGMEGPYSQILINSRPIFSGLAGVYGLELIPSSMIERIEVIRGGGSALYGGNAIAGTINLILKDPIRNTYEAGLNTSLTGIGLNGSGSSAPDNSVNFNTSVVSHDNKTGMSLYGFYRTRDPFDANGDGFSEIALLKNNTIGTRIFHRFGIRNKMTIDFFNINESRRGGNRFNYLPHEADIAEAIKHNITTTAITYDQFFRESDKLSIYVSRQKVKRDSYYGAHRSLKDYGKTDDLTYVAGVQYNTVIGTSNLTLGVENRGGNLQDHKLGYADIENATIIDDTIVNIPHTDNVTIANQRTNTLGVFTQYEITLNKLKISAGLRFDNYHISDRENEYNDNSGNVISPRITLKYDLLDNLQARASYSQGYRPPQIYDEDLHIETSGSRKVIHVNSPDLKQETSNSLMASLDYNKRFGKTFVEILAEGFYTKLNNPFVNDYSEPDSTGTVIYTRRNASEGASVQGVNIELNIVPGKNLSLSSGFTIQSSLYEKPQQFNERRFFRTPSTYGYITLDWDISKKWGISSTGNYTGKMLVPYFGNTIPDPDKGELRTSNYFFDFGLKAHYDKRLNGATLRIFAGIKNAFNSYQKDFDSGIDRDPGYIYGPGTPRTIYLGIKVGNFLN